MKLTTRALERAVSKSMLRLLLLVFLGSRIPRAMGVRDQKPERLPGLDEDEKLLNLFPGSEQERPGKPLKVVDCWREPGVFIRSLSLRMSLPDSA